MVDNNGHKLIKLNIKDNSTKEVLDDVFGFGNKDKFIYASVKTEEVVVCLLNKIKK